MTVKCIRKYWKDFDNKITVEKLKKQICMEEGYENLIVGQVYPVYGVLFWGEQNTTNYYICEDENSEYPIPLPADFFEIINGSIPTEWKLGFHRYSDGDQITNLVIEEWATDDMFYENLVNGKIKEKDIFNNYKTNKNIKHRDQSPPLKPTNNDTNSIGVK